MASVIAFHIALGEECVAQTTAVAVGLTQILLLFTSWVVSPVLNRTTLKQKVFAKLDHEEAKEALTVTAVPKLRIASLCPSLGLILVFLCGARRLLKPHSSESSHQSHSPLGLLTSALATAAFVLGGSVRAIFFGEGEDARPSLEPVSPCAGELYGDGEGACPYTSAFWSELTPPSASASKEDEAVPEPVDVLADVFLSMLSAAK